MSQAAAPSPSRSIYAISPSLLRTNSPGSIRARRHRRSRRLQPESGFPALETERAIRLNRVLRAFREGQVDKGEPCPLAARLSEVQEEVQSLEAWVESRDRQKQHAGQTIRLALELLRQFSFLTTLDFSVIPDEKRPKLIELLALEHRWCYAAAGTTRTAFKIETGRTGAR